MYKLKVTAKILLFLCCMLFGSMFLAMYNSAEAAILLGRVFIMDDQEFATCRYKRQAIGANDTACVGTTPQGECMDGPVYNIKVFQNGSMLSDYNSRCSIGDPIMPGYDVMDVPASLEGVPTTMRVKFPDPEIKITEATQVMTNRATREPCYADVNMPPVTILDFVQIGPGEYETTFLTKEKDMCLQNHIGFVWDRNCVQTPPTIVTEEGYLKNGQTGISAVTPFDLKWSHEGNISCYDKYEITLYKKNNPMDMSSLLDCDLSSPIMSFFTQNTNEKEITLNAGTNILRWNQAYCISVRGIGTSQNTQPTFATFRTNMFPQFVRMGMQYGDRLGNTDFPIGTSQIPNPNIDLQKCSTGMTSECRIPSNPDRLFGGDSCWISGVSSPNTDNIVTFWFEYEDTDNYNNSVGLQNEYFRHTIAILPSLYSGSRLDSEQMLERAEEYFAARILINNQTASLVDIGDYSDKATVLNTQIHNDAQNKIRIYYTIQFHDELPSTRYYAYASLENKVLDPLSETSDLVISDNHPDIDDPIMQMDSWFATRARVGIDSTAPQTNISLPIIRGYNTFDTKWLVRENSAESGISNISTTCQSTSNSIFFVNISGYSYQDATQTISNSISDSLNISQTFATSCFGTSQNELLTNILKTNSNLTLSYGFSTSNTTNYQNLSALKMSLHDVSDIACNKSSTFDINPKADTTWFGTLQSEVYSKNKIDMSTPFAITPQYGHLHTFNPLQSIYASPDDTLKHTSTTVLGTGTNTLLNKSLQTQELRAYTNINSKPNHDLRSDNWYLFLQETIRFNDGLVQTTDDPPTQTVSSMAQVLDSAPQVDCLVDEFCFVEFKIPVVFSDKICDAQVVIFAPKISISGGIKNSKSSNACIFVASEQIEILDSTISDREDPSTSSPYNHIEAFMISENSTVILPSTSIQPDEIYSDAWFVRGGIATQQSVENNQSLGLRNSIQPSLLINYDPRYIYIFQKYFETSNVRLREK